MVVFFVVLTFALFVTVDLLRERRRNAALLAEGETLQRTMEDIEPATAGGFKIPLSLSYHPGHTWVHWVSADQAYVGVDDFARRLIGKNSKITAPPVGTHVGQGEDVIRVRHDGAEIRLYSPVAGEVVGVNPNLKSDPSLPHRDAYGRGWLFKIRSPRLYKDLTNLMNGSLAQRWMEDTALRFQHRLMLASGSVIQDGGAPVEDLTGALNAEEWRTLADEFLGLRASRRS
jgi:glycine cleavage system H protein